MASYQATVEWSRQGANFLDNKYSREHTWRFDGGVTVAGSSSAHVVPVPYSNPSAVDPEEALIVALASCHMLSFLYVAGKAGFMVDQYRDEATGKMTKNAAGKFWVSEVTLNPKIDFSGAKKPSADDVRALHHQAHEECFIANSVKTDVKVASL
jgi:organic hydroperoxide reductase OsmC/OhrA